MRRGVRRRLEHAPARSPLAEPVFLNYITDNRRAEALPAPVRDGLFRRGVAAFGLRLAPAAALVAFAVLTGLLLLLLARPVDDIGGPGVTGELCALFCPRPARDTTDPDFTYTPTNARPGQTVDVFVRAVTPGAYDDSRMRLDPTTPTSRLRLTPQRPAAKQLGPLGGHAGDLHRARLGAGEGACPARGRDCHGQGLPA